MADKSIRFPARNPDVAQLILRISLGLVFIYAAIAALLHPFEWVGYIPGAVLHVIPASIALKGMAMYELALAIALLSGKYARGVALLCAITLFGIVLANLSQLIVTFRDVGLLGAAIALFVLS